MTPANSTTPDFETWVDACFTRPQDEELWERWQLPGDKLADYLARLFENPSFLGDKYTRKQLGDGIWWICGCVSGFFHSAMDDSVPDDARHRWIRAIGTLYTNLFDPLSLVVPRRQHDSDPLCVAVYMLWDMDALSTAQDYPELREDCFGVLQVSLNCQSEVCIRSGLHGLGHWIQGATHDGDDELRSRLEQCIDDFIHRYRRNWRTRLHEWLARFVRVRAAQGPTLIQYAKNARCGCIL